MRGVPPYLVATREPDLGKFTRSAVAFVLEPIRKLLESNESDVIPC